MRTNDPKLPDGPLPDALCRAVDAAPEPPVFRVVYNEADLEGILQIIEEDEPKELAPLTPDEVKRVSRLAYERSDYACDLIFQMLDEAVREVIADRKAVACG